MEVPRSGQKAGQETLLLGTVSDSVFPSPSSHVTLPELGKAVLGLEDGRQLRQQKTEN